MLSVLIKDFVNNIKDNKNKNEIILEHIKLENTCKERFLIDKNHTNLFKGYTTGIGYKKD